MQSRTSILAAIIGISVATGISVASAADAPQTDIPAAAAPAAASFSWTGVYLGGNVGYARSVGNGNAADCSSIQNISIVGQVLGDYCALDGTINRMQSTTVASPLGIGELVVNDPTYNSGLSDVSNGIYWNDWNHLYGAAPDSRKDEVVFFSQGPENGASDQTDASGYSIGGQVGYLNQSDNLVYGFEADAKYVSGLESSSSQGFDARWYDNDQTDPLLQYYGGHFQIDTTSRVDWMATFRGRVGLAVGGEGKLLPYLTGGAAIASVSAETDATSDYTDADVGHNGSLSTDRVESNFVQAGFVVGGGIEFALADNWSLSAEYQYAKLSGSQEHIVHYSGQYDSGNGFDIVHQVGLDSVQSASIKLNYHF
jgi:opacity protein-like surface antigen